MPPPTDELTLKLNADASAVFKTYTSIEQNAAKLKMQLNKISPFKLEKKDLDEMVRMAGDTYNRIEKKAKVLVSAKDRIRLAELKNEKLHQDRLLVNAKARMNKEVAANKAKEAKLDSARKIKYEKLKHANKLELDANRLMYEKDLANYKKSLRAKSAAAASGTTARSTRETSGNTSFMHKVSTTAQYTAAGSALYGIATAMKEVAKASIQYDNALFNTIAVLNTSRTEAEMLLSANRDLAIEYGFVTSELDSAAITLGRAGVSMSNLAEATEVTAHLARITGDTLEDASKVVSSFTMAFGLASSEVLELGNQLAYAANASKLSIADLGTMANYALSGAKAIGLTKEEVLALSTAFSNVGVNASTIGTQIRKFGKLVRDDSTSSIKFFKDMGIEQEKLMSDLRSNDPLAFTDFVEKVTDMNSDTYEASVKGMEILTRQFLDTIRVTGDKVISSYDNIKSNGDDLVAQSKIQALSIQGLWNSALASVVDFSSGIATSIADAFTDRDELMALTDSLKHLTKGSEAYLSVKKKIAAITGETSDSTNKLSLSELSKSLSDSNREVSILTAKLEKLHSKDVLGRDKFKIAPLIKDITKAKELSESLTKDIEEITHASVSDSKLDSEYTFLGYSAEGAIKIQAMVDKLSNVEATALKIREDAIALVTVQLDRVNDIESSSERTAEYERLTLSLLKSEEQYMSAIAKESEKRAKESKKAIEAEEKRIGLLDKALDKYEITFSKLDKERDLNRQIIAGATKGETELIQLSNKKAANKEKISILERNRLKASATEELKIDSLIHELKIEGLQYERDEIFKNRDAIEDLEDYRLDAYGNSLDAQMDLISATKDWQQNLDGTAGSIMDISKQLSSMRVDELNATKKQFDLDRAYTNEALKGEKSVAELILLKSDYDKNSAKIKQIATENEIQGYADLAGAASALFKQGSTEALVMIGIQTALSVATGITAIANAMANGDGYTAVARGLAVAASLKSFGVQLSGGGSSSVSQAKFTDQIKDMDDNTEEITDRLDTQIAIMQGFAMSGSAMLAELKKEKNISGNNISASVLNSIDEITSRKKVTGGIKTERTMWSNTVYHQFYADVSSSFTPLLQEIEKVSGAVKQNFYWYDRDENGGYEIKENAFASTSGYQVVYDKQYILDVDELKKQLSDTEILGIFAKYDALPTEALERLQEAIEGLSSVAIDAFSEIAGTTEDFKGYFDDITGTTKYAYKTLKESFDLVKTLGDDVPSILEKQIETGEWLDKWFQDNRDALQSYGVDSTQSEIVEYYKLLEEATGKIGIAFGNVEDIENYKDSIALVAETMATSNSNVKAYKDSLKDEDVLVKEMATALGVSYSEDLAALDTVFNTLSKGIDGLTDSELDFLNRNKDLIDSVDETSVNNINSWIESIGDLTKTADNLALSVGVEGFVSTISDLDGLFEKLKVGGLSDIEVEFLDANKDYLKAIEEEAEVLTKEKELLSELTDAGKIEIERTERKNAVTGEANKLLLDSIFAEEDRIKLLNEVYDNASSNYVDSVSIIEGSLDSLRNVIDSLSSSSEVSANSLNRYYSSMSATQQLMGTGSYEEYSESLAETIGLSSVLMDASNFKSSFEQSFAKSVAVNQFTAMEEPLDEQLKYLDTINNSILATNDLSEDMLNALTGFGGNVVETAQFAEGGFTGNSSLMVDSSGSRPAGIVHENEWVAPKWMIDSNPELFNSLESYRTGGYNTGMSTKVNSVLSSDQSTRNTNDEYLFVIASEAKKTNSILRRVSQGGDSLSVELIA